MTKKGARQRKYVVYRHTKAGKKLVGLFDDRETAEGIAETVADQAAMHYGHGAASFYRATLTLTSGPLKPKVTR